MTEEQKNLVIAVGFIGTSLLIVAIFATFAYLGHQQTGRIQQRLADRPRTVPDDEV
jgi:hypothetical protein